MQKVAGGPKSELPLQLSKLPHCLTSSYRHASYRFRVAVGPMYYNRKVNLPFFHVLSAALEIQIQDPLVSQALTICFGFHRVISCKL